MRISNVPGVLIYMADDDADDRYIMREVLQLAEPSVTIAEAEDGGDLIDLLTAWSQEPTPAPVSLSRLDMNMPKLNGLETITAIKANPALRHIPAVMISTSAEPDQVMAAYNRGINGHIKKPVNYSCMVEIAQAIKVCFLNANLG